MNDKINNSIRILTRAYYDYQNERLKLDGMIGNKKNGERKKGSPEIDSSMLASLTDRLFQIQDLEKLIEKDVKKEVHKHPLWKTFLVDIKGCGEVMAAVIISEIDIHKANTVSNIWSFAGLAPGKDRKVKGQKCTYNQFLRAKLCGVLGGSFLRAVGSEYSVYYYNMKNRLQSENWGTESKNPTDKKFPKAGHQHKAATRYMIKMFIKDLYVAWRTIENLPVREPYQEEYLGKKHA